MRLSSSSLALITLLLSSISAEAAVVSLPQTGQTTCWNNSGAVINCTGTGQDGDLLQGKQSPTPRFVDNADGTITDRLTGLIWLKNAGCNGATDWAGALNWAKGLASGSCGLTDGSTTGQWRIPNIDELESLSNLEAANNATWLSSQGFTGVGVSYWSSTPYQYTRKDILAIGMQDTSNTSANQVWSVSRLISTYSATAVRGGQHGTLAHLDVSKQGRGNGTVTADNGMLAWSGNSGHADYLQQNSTAVTLTPTAQSGSVFTGWSGDCSGTGTCTVTMNADRSVTARFGQNGVCGSATQLRTNIAPTENLCDVGTSTSAVLTGNIFSWTCAGYDGGGTASCQTLPIEWPLTVTVTGAGKVHTAPPPDIACTGACMRNYEEGTVVTPTAEPISGYTFIGWSGACNGTGSCEITMSEAKSLGAEFADKTPPVLTVPKDIDVVLNTPIDNQSVLDFLASASAVDAVDGTVTVTASTVPPLDTIGPKVITFTSKDSAGNEATGTATIYVIYGCRDTYLNDTSTTQEIPPFKTGSTVPVKLHLCDYNNVDVTSSVARFYFEQFSGDVPAGTPIDVTGSVAEVNNHFRVIGNSYLYNLGTTDQATGMYRIRAVLDDSTMVTIPLGLKPL